LVAVGWKKLEPGDSISCVTKIAIMVFIKEATIIEEVVTYAGVAELQS
jgi:hypothetical protein